MSKVGNSRLPNTPWGSPKLPKRSPIRRGTVRLGVRIRELAQVGLWASTCASLASMVASLSMHVILFVWTDA